MVKKTVLFKVHDDADVLRRSLWALASKLPTNPIKVVVLDDNSKDDPLSVLKLYSSRFEWQYLNIGEGDKHVADYLDKDFNNIIIQHPAVIAWNNPYDELIANPGQAMVYEIPQEYLSLLDTFGSNIHDGLVNHCKQWPVVSPSQLLLATGGTTRPELCGLFQGKYERRPFTDVAHVQEFITNV